MHHLGQIVWGHTWKRTLEKSPTNATSVTMQHLRQVIWRHTWKHTLEKSHEIFDPRERKQLRIKEPNYEKLCSYSTKRQTCIILIQLKTSTEMYTLYKLQKNVHRHNKSNQMLKLVQTVVILWYILDDIQWISYVLYIDIDIVCPWYSNIDIDDIPMYTSFSVAFHTCAPLIRIVSTKCKRKP